MGNPADRRSRSVHQLLLVAAVMGLSYVCIRTLRFTNEGLNLAFVCGFFLMPWFAIRSVLSLSRWPKAVMTVFLVPLLGLSVLFLLFTVSCDIPAHLQHRQLSRELSVVQHGESSVHLLWQETAGGAVGPHGLVVEQRMFVIPGLYLMKRVDYFEGAQEGGLSQEGAGRVRLHIPRSTSHQDVDKVYSLKPRVYF